MGAEPVNPCAHADLLLQSDGCCNSHPFLLKFYCQQAVKMQFCVGERPFINVRQIRTSHCWKIKDLGEDVPVWLPVPPAVGGGLFSARLAKGSSGVDRRSSLAAIYTTM